MKLPKGMTADRVLELAKSSMFGTENPGICMACGEETDGVEPDARNYPCPSCDLHQVFGAEEVMIMIVP